MPRFCYDQYSNASTEKLREVWRRKFRDLERTFRMQRNSVSITVCTDLIEDSFTLPSFFYTFETSCVLALSYSRSCMPFVFSSSLFFLVQGRSISNAALNFSGSFPRSAFPFFMPAFFAGMIGATAMFAWARRVSERVSNLTPS